MSAASIASEAATAANAAIYARQQQHQQHQQQVRYTVETNLCKCLESYIFLYGQRLYDLLWNKMYFPILASATATNSSFNTTVVSRQQ